MLSERAARMLNRGTTCGVLGLAVAGFAMSYDALHALAVAQGVSAALAWMWPLVVDGFIVVASLSVVRAVAAGRRATYPWVLVLAFSSISVAFNIVHAAPTVVARLVAAVPPAALVLSFELLMRQLRASLIDVQATHATVPALSAARRPRSKLDQAEVTSPLNDASVALPAASLPLSLLERARDIYASRHGQRVTGAVLARELGISDGYGRRLLRQLAANGGGAP